MSGERTNSNTRKGASHAGCTPEDPPRHVPVALIAAVALLATACINNGLWTAHPPADTTENTPVFGRHLLSVSCTSPTFCLAVGAGGSSATDPDLDVPIAQTWNGTAWTDLAWPIVGEDGSRPVEGAVPHADLVLRPVRVLGQRRSP